MILFNYNRDAKYSQFKPIQLDGFPYACLSVILRMFPWIESILVGINTSHCQLTQLTPKKWQGKLAAKNKCLDKTSKFPPVNNKFKWR
jgi:hypothetical protein